MRKLTRFLVSLTFTSLLLVGCLVFLALGGVFSGTSQLFGMLDEATDHFALLHDVLNGNVSLFPGKGGGDVPSDPPPLGDPTFTDTISAALQEYRTTVSISQLKLTDTAVKEQMSFFFFTHPEFFYVSTGYRIATLSGSNVVERIQFEYLYDTAEIPAMIATYEAHLREIIAPIAPDATDFDKVLYLHDYLVKHFSYDHRELPSDDRIRDAYRFLEEKTGVCQAYMLTMIALCDEVGVECLPVTSGEMNHAWNLCRVDGEWYHVDVTWDDAGGETMPVYPSYISYQYFLQSTQSLRASGRTQAFDAAAEATDTRYDAALFRECTTPMVRFADKYYCTYYDKDLGPVICEGAPEQMQVVKTLGTVRWEGLNGVYEEQWASLVVWQDKLLFNTDKQFCTYDPTTGNIAVLADLHNELSSFKIFGISDVAKDGTVTYVRALVYNRVYELCTWKSGE